MNNMKSENQAEAVAADAPRGSANRLGPRADPTSSNKSPKTTASKCQEKSNQERGSSRASNRQAQLYQPNQEEEYAHLRRERVQEQALERKELGTAKKFSAKTVQVNEKDEDDQAQDLPAVATTNLQRLPDAENEIQAHKSRASFLGRAHSPVSHNNPTMAENEDSEDSKLPAATTKQEENASMPSKNSAVGRDDDSSNTECSQAGNIAIMEGNNGTDLDSLSKEENEQKPPAVTQNKTGSGRAQRLARKRAQINAIGRPGQTRSPVKPSSLSVSPVLSVAQPKPPPPFVDAGTTTTCRASLPGDILVASATQNKGIEDTKLTALTTQQKENAPLSSHTGHCQAVNRAIGEGYNSTNIMDSRSEEEREQNPPAVTPHIAQTNTGTGRGQRLARKREQINATGCSSQTRSPVGTSSLSFSPVAAAARAKPPMVDTGTTTICGASLPGDNLVVSTTTISSRTRAGLPATIPTTALTAATSNPHPAAASTPTPGPLPPICRLKGGGTIPAPNQLQQPGTTLPQNNEAQAEIPGAYRERARAIGDIPVWARQDNTAATSTPTAQEPMEQLGPDMGFTQEANNREASGATPNSLVEARMVLSKQILQAERTQAEEVNPAEEERKSIELKRQNNWYLWRIVCVILALVCIVAGVTLGLVLGTRRGESEPTHFPTVAPSERPSTAPTGALDFLLQGLPEHTRQSLKNLSTPQWKAHDWLSFHPELPGMEEWRKIQLFALATFFYAMEGPEWPKDVQDRWLQYDQSECFWYSNMFGWFVEGTYEEDAHNMYNGTPCSQTGEFQNLNLDGLGVSGLKTFLPPEVSLLSSLKTLVLDRSGIDASTTDFIPSEFFQLTNLLALEMAANSLSGPIPSQLGLMTSLTELWLGENRLSGPIPTELGQMKDTLLLMLGENQLTGTIPTELGLLTSMRALYLYDNSLSGSIPTELGTITTMLDLSLNQNALTGPIPSELDLMSSIEWLWLFSNSLSGSLPSDLGLLTNVIKLELDINFLTGSIPTELGLLSKMEKLDLHQNSLTGRIQSELGLLTSMDLLGLQSNSLTGAIPTELGRLSNLFQLILQSNSLTGPIPSELGQISGMGLALLNDNSLTGIIPEEFNALAMHGSISLFPLDNNDLSGVVSEELCSLGLWNLSAYMFGLAPPAGVSFDCNDKLCGCEWCPCKEYAMMDGTNDTTLEELLMSVTVSGSEEVEDETMAP